MASRVPYTRSGTKRKVTEAVNEPPASKRKIGTFEKLPPVEENQKTKINWDERKEQCNQNYPEIVLDVARMAVHAALDVMEETRRDPSTMGPTFIFQCAGAIVKGVETTPWAYYLSESKEGKVVDAVCFIQKELYSEGNNYTEGQKKLKKVQLMKFKTQFQTALYEHFGFKISVFFGDSLFNSE